MSEVTITFDGHDLSSLILIHDIQRPIGNGKNLYIVVSFSIWNSDRNTIKRKLAGIFSGEKPKKLVFSDESDKYYFAKIDENIKMKEVSNYRSEGEIVFQIQDNIAYSKNPKSITVSNASKIVLRNTGTKETYPTITVTNRSDNGWISIINETGVFAVGQRESVNMDEKPLRQLMITELESFSNGRTTIVPTGDIGNGALHVSNVISLANKGAEGDGRHWCGGYNVANLNVSGAGVGTKRFYSRFQLEVETTRTSQTGLMKVLFLDKNNKIVAGYDVHKHSPVENKAEFILWYGGNSLRRRKTFTFTPSTKAEENPLRVSTHGSIDIEKVGAKISFFWWGKRHDVVVPELADTAIAKVGIFIGQFGRRNISVEHFPPHFKVKSMFAEVGNLDKSAGVKNMFLKGDVVKVDMRTGDIRVNDQPRADIFVKGGDLLSLPPGKSEWLFDTSKWSQGADVVVEYREEWK